MSASRVDSSPRVAVLLAAYNGSAFIESQLASLIWQIEVQVTIVIRDDGSSDDTPSIVAAFQARFPNAVRVVRDQAGPLGSAAANFFHIIRGLDASGFDYVALADQDDVWMPDKLVRAVRALRADDADGYSSNLIAFDAERGSFAILDKAQPQRRFDYLFQGASAGCTYVLSARAFDEIKAAMSRAAPAPAGLSHDWTIYAICRSSGLAWVQDKEARILYRQHAANAYGALRGMGGLVSRFRASRSGWYRRHIEWLPAILASNAQERAIIERLSRNRITDRLWLAARCGSFRRRPRDQILLWLALLTGTI